jgi:hypothetical protein
MSTHFYDYTSAEGRFTACGQLFLDRVPLARGVAITKSTAEVSCQRCLGSTTFIHAKARVPRALDDPRIRERKG